MKVIGLCGSSGSGKGYVCAIFEEYNVKCIDTDQVYKDLTLPNAPCVVELVGYFGKGIINADGSLNRGELARLVFQDEKSEQNRKALNEISHRHIRKKTEALIKEYEAFGYDATVVDAPVLFESGFDELCDATICVTAPADEKLERIIKRDCITKEQALARLSKQKSDDELKNLCDYEIKNTNGFDVREQIASILKALCIIR